MKIHTYAWLAWLLAGLVIVSTTRNPFYLLLLVFVLFSNQVLLLKSRSVWSAFTIKFSLSILVLSSALNAFISHFGETVLFHIPGGIPLISGPITLEAIVFGAINGLLLVAMFTFFSLLNAVVPVQNLVRLIPRAFHPMAVVTTIALTFIPSTHQQFLAIQEAQAMRGLRLRKLRDWLPLFIPLLIGGLERAMQIAESMTARGYIIQPTKQRIAWYRIIFPVSLLLVFVGWFLLFSVKSSLIGWSMILIGIILLAILFFVSGMKRPKTYFHQEKWTPQSLILLGSAFIVLLLVLLPIPGNETRAYNPYPLLSLPKLSISQLIAILMILFPGVLLKGGFHAADK